MDKKQAEEDAMRRAKDTQASAGKSTGMSGRDLVRFAFSFVTFRQLLNFISSLSSNTTPSGLKMRMKTTQTTGTWRSIVEKKSWKI